MNIQKCIKESFSVIGKEGSTNNGNNFVQKLWDDANSHLPEVENLAKKDKNDNLLGIWGAMSDFSKSFMPWDDNFSKGLYLAGVEVNDNAVAPENWVKWTIPAYEYIYVETESQDTFPQVIKYLKENNIKLAGAVHDYFCPEENGKAYMFFPIRKL